MKKRIFSTGTRRDILFRSAFILALAAVLAFEFWFTGFSLKHGVRTDLTPEGLYTLSDGMKKECAFLDELPEEDGDLRILFCSDPDDLIESSLSRSVYFTALELARTFERVKVETVNVTMNPTAVSDYRTTSLSTVDPDDVVISYGKNYRISSAASFWTQDSQTGALWSYNGEYKIASLMLSLTANRHPVAYFLTGHGETVYDAASPESDGSKKTAALYDCLTERGLEVALLDLSAVDAVPQDCALLILNDPRTDFSTDASKYSSFYYVSDLEKIDRYLVGRQGALMVAKDYRVRLPLLEDYLFEWGLSFSDSLVSDPDACLADAGSTATVLVPQYNTDTSSLSYALYSTYATQTSAPRTVISDSGFIRCAFDGSYAVNEPGSSNTSRTYTPYLSTTSAAVAHSYESATGEYTALSSAASVKDLCAIVDRNCLDAVTDESDHAYIFAAASADFFSSDLLGNPAYANYDLVSMAVKNVAFADVYAGGDIGGLSANATALGGKRLYSTALSETGSKEYKKSTSEVLKVNAPFTKSARTVITVILVLVPAAVLVTGYVIRTRRKYL